MQAKKSRSGKRKKRMRILIADDSAIVRRRLIALLAELENIEIVGEAQNVPDAIESVTRLKPDVVILDVRMPGGSGIDVLKKIKQDRLASVVMMFTNYPYPQLREKCLALGADYFFDKSTEVEKLLKVIKQFTERKRERV